MLRLKETKLQNQLGYQTRPQRKSRKISRGKDLEAKVGLLHSRINVSCFLDSHTWTFTVRFYYELLNLPCWDWITMWYFWSYCYLWMVVFIWDSNSLDLVVCLMIIGEEWPLVFHGAWMNSKGDFMHLKP